MGQLAAAENRHRRVRGNAHSDSHQSSDQIFYSHHHTWANTSASLLCVCQHACVFVSATDLAYSSEADRQGMWSFSTPKLMVCEDMCGRLTILVFFPLAVCLIDDSRLGGGETTTRPGVCTPC